MFCLTEPLILLCYRFSFLSPCVESRKERDSDKRKTERSHHHPENVKCAFPVNVISQFPGKNPFY